MKTKQLIAMAGACLLMTACAGNQASSEQTSGLDMAKLDTTVSPGADFFEFANGGWLKTHELPAEYARYAMFDMLAEKNQNNLRSMVEKLAAEAQQQGTNEQKVADLFNLVMDSVRLNGDGAAPIKADLDEINQINNQADVYGLLARLAKRGVSAYYSLGVGTDAKNSKQRAVSMRQAGLSLGQKDYYTATDESTTKIREAFKEHVVKMMKLAGLDEASANQTRDVVMKVENQLANAFRSRLEMRNPQANYNKMTLDEVKAKYPSIPFDAIFEEYGLKGVNEIIVGQPEAIEASMKLINSLPVNEQRLYLAWKLVDVAASTLSDDFQQENWDFNSRVLAGAQQMQPRWKRALNTVDGSLGEVLGQVYVEKYFPAAAKERMLQLVKNQQEALGERIKNLSWMSDETKQEALKKLASFRVKVGYPDEWKDYSGLTIDKSKSYWENAKAARLWRFEEMIGKYGQPVDPTEWHMTPQTVNAYYSSTTNEICFPAGILQPPFFDMNADDAFNYGGIGVVIGHEMSHGFDDSGRQFDDQGNMRDWWTEQDSQNFKDRAQVLIDYFSTIEVAPGVHADGALTIGENIGDHGGLKIAYTAFQKALKEHPLPVKDGFTPEQRFFLAYSGVWANKINDQEILRRTKTDVHSLGRWRVNGALPHIDAWYEAFGITENDPLFIPKEQRADVW